MNFSVIIVNYNSGEVLRSCLESLQKIVLEKKIVVEIYVVDNASSDNSLIKINDFLKTVTIIKNKENIGFGRACNQGANLAHGDILFFLNPDTIVTPNLFLMANNLFSGYSEFGILAPQLYTIEGKLEKFGRGQFPTLTRLITRNIEYILNSENNPLIEVDWVSGAALLIRRELFERLKGFDENYFMYYEDIDLCYRANQLGYKTAVMTLVSVRHLRGKSLSSDFIRTRYYDKSQLYFFSKFYSIFSVGGLWLLRHIYRFFKFND